MADSFELAATKGAQVVVFARLFPKLNPRLMTLDPTKGNGTNVYTVQIPRATRVVEAKINAVNLVLTSLAGLATPTANRYFYDREDATFYLDTTGLPPFTNLATENFISIEYELSIANKEIDYHYDPKSAGTFKTIWYPYLSSFPDITKSVDGDFQGFAPSISSSVVIANNDGFSSQMLNTSSLAGSDIIFYLGWGDFDTSTVKLIFTGTVNAVSFTGDDVTIGFTDQSYLFDEDAVLPYGAPLRVQGSTFPYLDPKWIDKIIPTVYGVVDNLEGMCTDFKSGAADENTSFILARFGGAYIPTTHDYIVQSSPAPTQLRIYLNTTNFLNPGDALYNPLGTGGTRRFYVQEVFPTYVEGYTSAATVPFGGGTLQRGPIGYIRRFNQSTGVVSTVDFGNGGIATANFLGGNVGFKLTSSIFNNDPDNNIFLARVYGVFIPSTSISTLTGMYTKWYGLLYRYLQEFLPLSKIDVGFHTDGQANPAKYEDCGFTIPLQRSTEMPTHRTVISNMLSTRFAGAFGKPDGKISIYQVSPITTTDYEFDSSDIFDNTFIYDENIIDLSKRVECLYREQEFFRQNNVIQELPFSFVGVEKTQGTSRGYDSRFSESANVSNHYQGKSTQRIETIIQMDAQAQVHANRLRTIYLYPYNTFTFTVSLKHLDIEIGETVRVKLDNLPGYSTINGSNEILGRIVSLTIREDSIDVTCWDQIGIQQNQGVWS